MAYKEKAPLVIAEGGTNAITMATSTGIVKYDGTSLVTSSAAKIDSSNRMTNSSQPAFFAYLSASVTNVTGDGTIYQLGTSPNPLTVLFDRGSNFNTNGTFTAPVTGIYFLSTYILCQNLTATMQTNMGILTTLSPYFSSFGGSFTGNNTLQITVLASMTAGDTAIAQVAVNNGTKTAGVFGDGVGDLRTYFCGYLVC